MKITFKKEVLLDELQLLQGIVEKRNTMPILANILMSSINKKIELTGTDLEVGLKTRIEADIEAEGTITINGKTLFDIIRSFPSGKEICFTQKNDKVDIKSGDIEFKINCQSSEEFPAVPDAPFDKGIRISLEEYKRMIDLVYYAIPHEQRYYLNGALMSLKNKQIELVSTDGHRLSYTTRNFEDLNIDKEISYIVGKKSLNEIRKFTDGDLDFDFDENNLYFQASNRILISRIIDSKFPNYQAVIPKENPHKLTVSREELADSLRRVVLLSVDRSKGVKLSLEKNKLKLFSSNPEIGEARDQIPADYSGASMDIGFNAQYLLDFLSACDAEEVIFEIKDANSAVLIKAAGEESIKNLYILMPMKI